MLSSWSKEVVAARGARDRGEWYREPELSVVEHCKTAPLTAGKEDGRMECSCLEERNVCRFEPVW